MNKTQKQLFNTENFDTVSLKLASPETILSWSFGEITKPETINYRTQRAEKKGLFDEKIFGPEKDYECYCGKYKGIRYKGIVCERCGVEITRSVVRRERMGHIELSTPVSHIWFLRSIPSRISLILGLSSSDVEKVVYFAGYIITKVIENEKIKILKELDIEYKTKTKSVNDEKTKTKLKELFVKAKNEIENIKEGTVLDEIVYHRYAIKYGTLFETNIGAEAIYDIFKNLDLNKLVEKLETRFEKAGSIEREKINKRLSILRSMVKANIRPEWMFMVRIPVIPPALRPMVALEGGRHATSDVNDLYRRVINRNNRLKKLKEINAPDVILRNEKRILQEAVDALFDNSIRHGNTLFSAMSQAQRRPLKSLSDYLKGKQGYFRQNLLGKRVDYSGRSVIVVGPDLKLDECGLPKHMALELFRPFIIAKLLERELAYNIRGAGRLIDEGIPEVWAMLEEVIYGKYVLLNRAPTLHRQGIQAFRPILIEGNAIQVHPLVCSAFNADFDGDMMAVHVPLSKEAQKEAKNIISANKNILKPGSGDPIVSTKMLDIVLGCYWMTKIIEKDKGEGKIFSTPNNAVMAYEFGDVGFRAKIKVLPSDKLRYAKFEGKPFETSVGRILFNSTLPNDYPFVDYDINNKSMMALIEDLIKRYGLEEIPSIINKIKTFGFKYVTHSGITWGIDDVTTPKGKEEIVKKAKDKSKTILEQFNDGLLSKNEKRRMNIENWISAKNDIEKQIPDTLKKDGSAYDMWKSGARGSIGQITQMSGMVGLMQNTKGDTIEFPIIASFKDGLTPIEYFITTHGSRKGLSDTALQTSKAGYLTRRLFDVAQDVIITEEDCGIDEGVVINKISALGLEISIAKNIKGRILVENIVDPKGKVLFKKGQFLTSEDAKKIEDIGLESIAVRSPMVCKTRQGICQNCYGADMATNKLIEIGEAVGTIAAQAIGEPGTQLTMNTKHIGGAVSVGGDVTQGLPRVEEVFEKRIPKNPATISHIDGLVSEIKSEGKEKIIILLPEEGEKAVKSKKNTEYSVNYRRMLLIKVGDKVKKGQFLTDGSANINELFKFAGRRHTQDYIIAEINKIYELQGASISRKHTEVIIKQMFSRLKIKESFEESLTQGDIVDQNTFAKAVEKAKEDGVDKPIAESLVLGMSEVALSRKSFLSAASFQNTTKILINSAIRGSEDKLIGLKENVIIGRLIPAGTGFEGSAKNKMIKGIDQNEEENKIE